MADNNEERRREVLKLYFEFFKHLTTLSAATALVLLAVFREMGVSPVTTLASVAVLGVSLLVSFIGMAVTVNHVETAKAGFVARWLMLAIFVFACSFFVVALVRFWQTAFA